MFYWIYDIPTQTLAAMTAGLFVGFSVVGCVLLRPFLRLFVPARGQANDVVGYVLSCFCVFYGILLGLLAVAAYQNYGQVELNVTREASSLAALYYDVTSYPQPYRERLQESLRDYCVFVIERGWPAHRQGLIPKEGGVRMRIFQNYLVEFQPQSKSEEIIHAETLRQFNNFIEHRRIRLHSVTTGIPIVMWYVVLVGAIINIALVWLFDMKLISHLFLGSLLAFYLGTMIFLIAAMDNPFRGEVSVSPEPFKMVLELMNDLDRPPELL